MVKLQLEGVYFTFKTLSTGQRRYYYYAYRGGPLIWKHDGRSPLKKAPPAMVEAYQRALGSRVDHLFAGVIQQYLVSPEHKAKADRTRADYRKILDAIADKFGSLPIGALDDRNVRKHFIKWRDSFAATPRRADHHIAVLSTVLAWAKDHSIIDHNRAEKISNLYTVDKSEQIWTQDQIEAACAATTPETAWAIRLASLTGLRRGDLVDLKWSEIMPDHIARPTNKSRGRRIARVPLFTETRALLEGIEKRSIYVLTNSWRQPWKETALSLAVRRAREKAGLETLTLHDLRRTFVTKAAAAGINDREIALMVGWSEESVRELRFVYVSGSAVIRSIAERLER